MGITRIERIMTDNALAYRHGRAFIDAVAQIGAKQKFIKPHCPWQNGKVERFNRTLQTEWAYRHVFTSNQHRSEEHTSELQSRGHLVCRLLLEKKKHPAR